MLSGLFYQDEPEVGVPHRPETIFQEASSIPSTPPLSLTHPAMYQALDVTEITVHIRQELCGYDLKSVVLISRLWWKAFAPYLWENIYIDANPEQDDRDVIFRNGLAARCLTLSIYDPLDRRGVANYVAEKCRNVTQLHLKLFSQDLVIIDGKSKQNRCNGDPQQKVGDFALGEECKTDILDNLFNKLPHVSDITISIAHEDLEPEVLWCLAKLPRLRKLTVNGGLNGGVYVVKKNWKCHWALLMCIMKECQYLESLTVAWESHREGKQDKDDALLHLSDMFQTVVVSAEPDTRVSIPKSEQVQSLRQLDISDCELHDSFLDIVYASCPNLRKVCFKKVKVEPPVLERHIEALTNSCPLLSSFEFYDPSMTGKDYSTVLLKGPLLNIATLKVDASSRPDYENFIAFSDLWRGAHSITSLELCNITSYKVLFAVLSNMAGLTHLTLSGILFGKLSYGPPTNGYDEVISYFQDDQSPGLRLPEFACQDTLVFLDVTHLSFGSLKCHKLFFDRVQSMPRLKRLEINNRQLQDARIEETWTDPDEDPDLINRTTFYPDKVIDPKLIKQRRYRNYGLFNYAYANTSDKDRGPEGEAIYGFNHWGFLQEISQGDPGDLEGLRMAAEAIPDKVFCLFPAVEFLYVFDDEPIRSYWDREHYISEHIAGALVRMMPKLRVMAYDKALGEGLKRVKKTYSHVIFDQIRT
ncbi:hypothetical protein BGX27_001928 [Mortierella sp. AM989]|nr:hypothetical protein BGX27_001928 [Mortierella sp. AM989]